MTAGTMLAAMTDGSGEPKFSAAIIVLGFGEITFPHFAPPIMARSSFGFGTERLFPSISAIGATVMTATSTNTPTPVRSIAETAIARYICLAPSLLTIVREMAAAAPVFISTPESTPAARIRNIAGAMSLTPETM